MRPSWADLCPEGAQIEAESVTLVLETGRRQRVFVREEDTAYQLRTIVVRRATLDSIKRPALMAWQRNRATAIVGFRIDREGRLVAETWVPKVGLTSDEFRLYLTTLATEADRFEHQLTGRDTH